MWYSTLGGRCAAWTVLHSSSIKSSVRTFYMYGASSQKIRICTQRGNLAVLFMVASRRIPRAWEAGTSCGVLRLHSHSSVYPCRLGELSIVMCCQRGADRLPAVPKTYHRN